VQRYRIITNFRHGPAHFSAGHGSWQLLTLERLAMKKCSSPTVPSSCAAVDFVGRVREVGFLAVLAGAFWRCRPGVRRCRPTVEGLEDRTLLTGPPVAVADTYLVLHDHTLTTPAPGVLANDMNTNGASVTQASGPAHGTFALSNTGAFTYTPSPHFMGQDSFSYYDVGPGGTSNTVTATINVADLAPTPQNDSYAVAQGHTLNATSVLANDSDPDGDPLTITGFTNPASGTFNFNQQTGTFAYTPAAGFTGQVSFTYTVSDGILSANATATINVMPASLSPIMVPNFQGGAQIDSPTSLTPLTNAVDPNTGGTLDFSTVNIVNPPSNGQVVVDPTTGVFYYTPSWLMPPAQSPPSNPPTPLSFQFTVRDNLGAVSNLATVTFNGWVSPVVAGSIVAGDVSGSTHTLQPVAIDVLRTVMVSEGNQVDPTSVAIGTGSVGAFGGNIFATNVAPQHGTASVNPTTGLITYTPAFGYVGFDFFTYTVQDTVGDTAEARVYVSINPTSSPRLQPDSLGGQMLVVDGTPNNDNMLVTPGPHPGDVVVSVNGVKSGPFHPTSRVVLFGDGGANRIQVSPLVTVPAWLVGGPGNDILMAGGGPSVLLGGPGNDLLIGVTGRDLLIGGTGSDTLIGNRDDILVAGTTSFDADQASLNAILLEWYSSRSFTERVENLTGQVNSTSAQRLNGNVYLTLATVQDDGARDLVFGVGQDLIFVTRGGPTGDLLFTWEALDVVFALPRRNPQAPV
jgi:hypothetical protein